MIPLAFALVFLKLQAGSAISAFFVAYSLFHRRTLTEIVGSTSFGMFLANLFAVVMCVASAEVGGAIVFGTVVLLMVGLCVMTLILPESARSAGVIVPEKVTRTEHFEDKIKPEQ